MKRILSFLLLLTPLFIKSQDDYTIITLDSIISTNSNQGIYGLTAEVYQGDIHLAYIQGNDANEFLLVYEIRNNGEQILKEIAHTYSNPPWLDPETAIQFDENGNPHIYCAQISGGETYFTIANKENGNWSTEIITYRHIQNFLNGVVDGSHHLGFVTRRDGTMANNWNPVIDYFSNENGAWETTTISSSSYEKIEPATINFGENSFVAYLEHHSPDTTILFIHKRSPEGIWTIDYQEMVSPSEEWNTFTGRYCVFGINNNTVHLIHTLKSEEFPQPLSHLVYIDGTWSTLPISNREEYIFEKSNINAIEFSENGDLLMLNRDIVWGISPDNEYFEFRTPLQGPAYGYYDYALVDNVIYMYIISGDKNFPFGDAMLFYEAFGSINTLTTLENNLNYPFKNVLLYPNPASTQLELIIESTKDEVIAINWFDTKGQMVKQHRNLPVHQGMNSINLSNHGLPQGAYFLQLRNNNRQQVISLMIQ